jgi:hypothetical protein
MGYLGSLKTLSPGDDICFLFETEEEQRSLVAPYLRLGLEENQRILYISAESDYDKIRDYLCTDEGSLALSDFPEQFLFLSFAEVYLKEGSFDQEGALRFFERTIAESRQGPRTDHYGYQSRQKPVAEETCQSHRVVTTSTTFLTKASVSSQALIGTAWLAPSIVVGVIFAAKPLPGMV